MPTLEEQFIAASAAAAHERATVPYILRAHYNKRLDRVIVYLNNHTFFAFRPRDIEGLESAPTAYLKIIEISPSGYGLHFPALDAHYHITSLMNNLLGSRKWMAARLGAAGGATKSKAKSSAARTNGKLGGRPRKTTAA